MIGWKRLSALGDQLEIVPCFLQLDFESLFGRGIRSRRSAHTDSDGEGRLPPFDPVLMFKILVIQRL